MRILLFGTGPFAVPSFRSLLDSGHDVMGLVTRPITDPGKRRKTSENPTRDLAEARGLRIFDPPSCNEAAFVEQLEQLKTDLFVVCDYGQILSRKCLAASQLGGINLHGSLLPRYRGAAPINWAIFHGDLTLGVTVIHMTPKLDGGPCLAKASIETTLDETAEDIEPRLAQLGIEPVQRAIEMLDRWDGESQLGELQDPKLATRAPRLNKSDGQIDWSRSANDLVNQVRAFQPWPGSFTNWHASHRKQPMRLILHKVEAISNAKSDDPSLDQRQPGQVAVSDARQLLVVTGDGLLSVRKLQPAGKKPMLVADFLRGNQPEVGDWFQ